MEIRNLMEDAVLAAVGELFSLEEKDQRLGYCTCGQCRLDVACYVLNRIKPEYIVSSRGMAYSERDFQAKLQRQADIISLAKEGWALVTHRPRATYDHAGSSIARNMPEGPAFNLPAVMGTPKIEFGMTGRSSPFPKFPGHPGLYQRPGQLDRCYILPCLESQ